MFENFYGLHADPFRLSADPRFCFHHRSYSRARASVEYALYRAEGFVMVTGPPGTGKTTLVKDLVHSLPSNDVVIASLVSTQLGPEDLLRMTAYSFGLDSDMPRKALLLQRLMEFLAQQHRQGLRSLLIIDEAQDLSQPALEELRLLTNLQRNDQPLLQIVLLGQEGLRKLVRRPDMEQLHQRLVAAWHLEPLSPEEMIGYVQHRLRVAGWNGDPAIEPGVLPVVHHFSGGVPRRINLICSRLLLHGFVNELHSLTEADAEAVLEDLRQEELTRPHNVSAEGPEIDAPHDAGDREILSLRARRRASSADWSRIDRGLFATAALNEAHSRAEAGDSSEGSARTVPEPAGMTADPGLHEAPAKPAAARMRASWESSPPGQTETLSEPPTQADGGGPMPARAAADHSPHTPAESPQQARPDAWQEEVREQAALASDPGVHIVTDRDWQERGLRPAEPRPSVSASGRRAPSLLLWAALGAILLLVLALALLTLRPGVPDPAAEGGEATAADALQRQWQGIAGLLRGTFDRGVSNGDEVAPAPAQRPQPSGHHDATPGVTRPETLPEAAGRTETETGATADASVAEDTGAPDTVLELPPFEDLVVAQPDAPADSAPAPAGTFEPETPDVLFSGSVFFDFDSTAVDSSFDGVLDAAVGALEASEASYAEVFGYADTAGDPVYNLRLSERRARAVAQALIRRGAAAERLQIEGLGPQGNEAAAESPRAGAEHRVVVITVREPGA